MPTGTEHSQAARAGLHWEPCQAFGAREFEACAYKGATGYGMDQHAVHVSSRWSEKTAEGLVFYKSTCFLNRCIWVHAKPREIIAMIAHGLAFWYEPFGGRPRGIPAGYLGPKASCKKHKHMQAGENSSNHQCCRVRTCTCVGGQMGRRKGKCVCLFRLFVCLFVCLLFVFASSSGERFEIRILLLPSRTVLRHIPKKPLF